jgi:hypothetical protein
MNKLLLAMILMTAAIGCTSIQAVGPLAKPNGKGDKADKDLGPPDPVVIPAQTPVAPKCLVRPEDVTAENVDLIKQRLKEEYEFDKKNMPSVPVTVEVSQIK